MRDPLPSDIITIGPRQVAWCVRETGTLLRQFGYDPVSQVRVYKYTRFVADLFRCQKSSFRPVKHTLIAPSRGVDTLLETSTTGRAEHGREKK